MRGSALVTLLLELRKVNEICLQGAAGAGSTQHHTALTPSPASAFWGPPVQGTLKLTCSSLLNCTERSLAGVVQPRESAGSVRYCPSFVTEADGKSFN